MTKLDESPMHYWNFYCAIEMDLKNASKFVEFSESNFQTHSIEFTRLLLSSCSEIDIILKEICSIIDNIGKVKNVNDYKNIITLNLPDLIKEEVNISFSGVSSTPWESWLDDKNPSWWTSYNNVKHQRNKYYSEANLANTIDAICALFICVNYYYLLIIPKLLDEKLLGKKLEFNDITRILKSKDNFVRFSNHNYYDKHLII